MKPIDISTQNEVQVSKKEDDKLQNSEIEDIKEFLIKEYGVDKKCLEIN